MHVYRPNREELVCFARKCDEQHFLFIALLNMLLLGSEVQIIFSKVKQ